jgi:hypothetical protein
MVKKGIWCCRNFWEKIGEYGLLCGDGLYYDKIIYYEQRTEG